MKFESATNDATRSRSSTDAAGLQDDLVKLIARVQEVGAAIDHERAATHTRIETLHDDLQRLAKASTERARSADTDAQKLREELAQREETVREQREELANLRRRVDGFEGLKRTMQSL